MRLTLSRRAIAPCAALATTAILGSALVAAPASTATAAEAFARTISVEGTATSDSTGSLWEARAGFTGGTYWKPAAFEVAGTVDDKLYQAELWGLTAWQTAVPSNGEYDVTLRMREVFYSAPDSGSSTSPLRANRLSPASTSSSPSGPARRTTGPSASR